MIPNRNCRCGKPREKKWHLVCPDCWARIPRDLQIKVYHECKTNNGSPSHLAAIRECFEFLIKNNTTP